MIAALGVDAKGAMHVLGIWEGATENAPTCRAVLNNLVTRGLDVETTRLFVIDGSQGLRAAIRNVFGKHALVQRCQVHKMRNVESHLPKNKQKAAKAAMREAYNSTKVETAKRLLSNLARTLERDHPSAAASIREGLDETLTVMALGLPRALERSFSTTNRVDNLNDRIRQIARCVKRWRGGSMILRWTAAGPLRGRARLPPAQGTRAHAQAARGAREEIAERWSPPCEIQQAPGHRLRLCENAIVMTREGARLRERRDVARDVAAGLRVRPPRHGGQTFGSGRNDVHAHRVPSSVHSQPSTFEPVAARRVPVIARDVARRGRASIEPLSSSSPPSGSASGRSRQQTIAARKARRSRP